MKLTHKILFFSVLVGDFAVAVSNQLRKYRPSHLFVDIPRFIQAFTEGKNGAMVHVMSPKRTQLDLQDGCVHMDISMGYMDPMEISMGCMHSMVISTGYMESMEISTGYIDPVKISIRST